MRKFFKIFGVILGVVLLLCIGIVTYFYFNAKDLMEKRQERDRLVKNFESTNSDDYYMYSISHNKAGDFNTGFKYLNKAVELAPDLHLGYRGWIRLRKIRDYDKALADFDRLDSLTPNFVDAPWNENIDFLRGECHYGNKDYEKAILCFNRNVKHQKEDWADIQSFVYLGLCEYELGNYEKAISEFKRALVQYETVPESYYGMAKAYYKLGDLEKAIAHILKAEEFITYKRKDPSNYNEFLNEIYLAEVIAFKQQLYN